MQRLPVVLCSLLTATSLSGCGGHSAAPSTDLTLVAVNPWVGRAGFHLACAPAGGDVADPARACAALAARPDLVTRPKPFVCFGGTSSWWDVTITGRLQGRPIRTHTSTCWTPQMETIRRLGIGFESLQEHLLPRRREAVFPGTRRGFAAGALRPGDLVTCAVPGRELANGVPVQYTTSSTGYAGTHVTTFTLAVARNRDGSVTVTCGTGASAG